MAQLTITIPDAVATRALTGFTNHHGYQTQVPDTDGTMIDNPETRLAFAKRMIREWIIDAVRKEEGEAAAQTARTSAESDVLSDIVLS